MYDVHFSAPWWVFRRTLCLLDRFVPARRRHPRYTPLAVVSDAAIKAVGVSALPTMLPMWHG